MASKPRLSVLTRRSDFLVILKFGQRVRPCDWLLVNFVKGDEGKMRCGWTLPRNVGNAVIRNRLRRWSRVYFRRVVETNGSLPVDVNLVFRKAPDDFYKKLKYDSFSDVLDRAWVQVERRLKILPPSAHQSVQGDRVRPSGRRVPL